MPGHQRPNPDTDPHRPPAIPTQCFCVHCGQEYESYLIEWHEHVVNGRPAGSWCCPTPACAGKGFGQDILPTDPDENPVADQSATPPAEEELEVLWAHYIEDATPSEDIFRTDDADTPPPVVIDDSDLWPIRKRKRPRRRQ